MLTYGRQLAPVCLDFLGCSLDCLRAGRWVLFVVRHTYAAVGHRRVLKNSNKGRIRLT